ncbi:MAG: rRNA pseudouridine synthase [Anaerolineae bacterium]|nr:rRNA pseudouridine synthase [Anaerolineae bacterium]
MMRLQKVLSQAGVASRRASEELIRAGRVRVNGQVVSEMGVQVDPRRDEIVVDGHPVQIARERRYLKLHKPAGYLSVMSDQRGRRDLGALLPGIEGVHPVGRLDRDSEGLMLLTDDGALTQRLTHPRYRHTKEYLVLVRGALTRKALRTLREGVELEEGKTAPATVRPEASTPWGGATRGTSWLRVTLHEGRKRQIRRMCESVGHPVVRLIRVRIGPIELGDLGSGAYRDLTAAEMALLRQEVDWPGADVRRRKGRGQDERGG